MINIALSRVEESGEEVLVKSNTYENEDEAKSLYETLTDEYAEQTIPFFDKGEQLIRLDILPADDKTDDSNAKQECYFEYNSELLNSLSGRI